MTADFAEIADRVYVLRHPMLDVNVTLVVGDGAALLVDTLSTAGQATALTAAVRAVTRHPLTVVNTHHHFDHCFGNATVAGNGSVPIYAHAVTLALLRDHPETVRRLAYQEMREREPALAEELVGTVILAPTHPVHRAADLDVGGRPVWLRHAGRGHTAGDLLVYLPDADVLVAGDLLEESGPPDFGESYPLQWPDTVGELLHLTTSHTVIVPGHGAVVDVSFARAQHADLAALRQIIRDGHAAGLPPERVATRAPFGSRAALTAARRGYAELSGAV